MVAKQVFDHSLRESGKRFSSSLKASNRYSAAELEYSGVHDLASIDQSVLNHLAASDTLAAQRLRMLLDYATAADPENPGEKVNWLTQYSAWCRYHGTSHRMTEDERERFREEVLLASHTFNNRSPELTGTNDGDLAWVTLLDRNPNAQQREIPRE